MGVKRVSVGVPRGLVLQGDLLLVPVSGLPEGADRVGSGRLVLAEGEATGHAHVVDDVRASLHRRRRPRGAAAPPVGPGGGRAWRLADCLENRLADWLVDFLAARASGPAPRSRRGAEAPAETAPPQWS